MGISRYPSFGPEQIPYVICISSDRPVGPELYQGLMIYELDTQSVLVWNGSDWTPPWNTSWGSVVSTEDSTGGNFTTAVTYVVTTPYFTAYAGRRYAIDGLAVWRSDAADQLTEWRIALDLSDTGNAALQLTRLTNARSTGAQMSETSNLHYIWDCTSTASSAYEAMIGGRRTDGSGTIYWSNAIISVTDIGPTP